MENNHERDSDRISKSQMKREMLALQELGEKLVALSEEQIQQLEIPEDLKNAVLQARTIKKHGALRRQLQYVGRLMRDVNGDDIRQQYENVTQQSAAAAANLHKIEQWRDRLLDDDEDQALQEFLQQFPDTDRQQLRQLLRDSHQERRSNKPPRAYRKLFHFIKDTVET